MAIAHFALGAMATALLLMVAAPGLLRSPTVIALGGCWALVPDAQNVLPVGADVAHSIHVSPWADVFWFHHWLDHVDPADSPTFAAGTVFLLLVVLATSELVARFRTSPDVGLTVDDQHG